ncbi:hypothetical protein V6N11_060727 [Hibiscus sabdariffa]|uniref:t-SNARE coiled-coil homology domain-containing protein n=1 Tax=Hibiscus sabdariffa TaxID=183260 RepID=A0ABR2QR77_9ROSI
MPESKAVIGLKWEPKLPGLPLPSTTTSVSGSGSVSKSQNEPQSTSLWKPNQQLVDGLFVPPNDPSKVNKLLRKQVKDTAGSAWFDMPAPTLTPELKKDLQLLKLRGAIDPKRHYKKDSKSKALPKYFQARTVIESVTDYYSGRMTKNERKATLADELLSDPAVRQYRKRKVREIEERNRPAGNDKWKIKEPADFMATAGLQMSPQLEQIHGEIRDLFRALSNGFQRLDKMKDSNRQSKQLEELTGKMRECKRLIKEFDREIKGEESKNPPEVNKQLNDEKQSMIKELNSYVALRKTYMNTLGNKKIELFDMGAGVSEPTADENVKVASSMSNQELVDHGMKTMDETDQVIERSKKVVEQTIEVGTQTASTLKGQTDQMGRIVNELDTIQFSIKKASQLVKEIGRQVATDKCIMLFLFLIVCGVIAIIVVKIVNPNNKNIRDIPGLAPPAPSRRLLYLRDPQ